MNSIDGKTSLRKDLPRPYFEHGGIEFRVPQEKDLGSIAELRNEFGTWSNLSDPMPVFAGDQRRWFGSMGRARGKFYFVAASKGVPFLGIVRMDEHDPVNRSIRVGADVVSGLRGRGWGGRIYSALIRYCFDYLNVRRVWLLVLETNVRARRLYDRCGFREEGRMTEAVFRDGCYVDYVLMSLLEHKRKT